MKKKLILKLLILMLIGFIVIVLSYRYLDNLNAELEIYVASVDIETETIITEDMIKKVPIGYDEKIRFFEDAYDDKTEIVGKVTSELIHAGSVIGERSFLITDSDENDVLDDNGDIKSDYFIENDERLAFISLPTNQALGGDLKKGNLIDIVYTSSSEHTGGTYASILLQQIEVYKVVKNTLDLEVQLIVKPEQGMILSLAKYNGKLDFMLASERSERVDIIPKLPQDLYIKLLEAGYMLVDQTGRNVSTLNESTSDSIEAMEQELANAEKNLEEAFNAMNAARAALESEKNERSKKDLYTLVQELELAVRDLETAVDDNKNILESMKGEENE